MVIRWLVFYDMLIFRRISDIDGRGSFPPLRKMESMRTLWVELVMLLLCELINSFHCLVKFPDVWLWFYDAGYWGTVLFMEIFQNILGTWRAWRTCKQLKGFKHKWIFLNMIPSFSQEYKHEKFVHTRNGDQTPPPPPPIVGVVCLYSEMVMIFIKER